MSFVPIQKVTKVPLMHGEQRLIIATCEKGMVEDVNDMKDIKAGLDEIKGKYPNFVDYRGPTKFSVRSTRRALPIRSRSAKFWNKAAKERIAADGEAQEDAHRHSRAC